MIQESAIFLDQVTFDGQIYPSKTASFSALPNQPAQAMGGFA
jgi:hypothetical protein